MIHNVQPLNKVTVRDAEMTPSVDEFSEEFTGYSVLTSVDHYLDYDQMMLDRRSRDLTTFQTLATLVRQTCLSQGWMNFVVWFQRAIVKKFIGSKLQSMLDLFSITLDAWTQISVQ